VTNGGSLLEESFNISGGRAGGHFGIRGIELERGTRGLSRSADSRGGLVLGDLEERHGSSFGKGVEELVESTGVCCNERVGCGFGFAWLACLACLLGLLAWLALLGLAWLDLSAFDGEQRNEDVRYLLYQFTSPCLYIN